MKFVISRMELVALIGAHMEDGRVDHREKLEQVPVVRALRAKLNQFLAGVEG